MATTEASLLEAIRSWSSPISPNSLTMTAVRLNAGSRSDPAYQGGLAAAEEAGNDRDRDQAFGTATAGGFKPRPRAVSQIAAQVSTCNGIPLRWRSSRMRVSGSPGINTSPPGLRWPRGLHVACIVMHGVGKAGRSETARGQVDRQHPVGDASALAAGIGPDVPPPVRHPASNSHMNASPDPLCSPKVRSAPSPLAELRMWVPSIGPYSVRGSEDNCPDGSINAPCGTGLPPLEATRTLPSATNDVAKSRMIGPLSVGHADADRIRGKPPIHAAVGCHQFARLNVNEVDRDQARGGGPFTPVADASDMAGIAQADRRHPGLPGFRDAEIHRQRVRSSGQTHSCRRGSPELASHARRSASARPGPCPPAARGCSAGSG